MLLGRATESGQAILLGRDQRVQHAVVLGKSGVGKTHFLQHLAYQHFERNEGFCFFDFHGDAVNRLLELAAQFPEAANRLVLFDPTDPAYSPGLNPLEIDPAHEHQGFSRTAELTAILKQRWGMDSFGARTEELMRHVFYTLAVNGYTLVDASALLTSRHFRSRLIAQLRNQEVLSYWLDRYEPLSEPMKAVFREPLLNKLSGFVTDPLSRQLLGQQHSTLSFATAMAEGQWVLINLSKGLLRDHAHTLGNLIFAKLQFDVMARASLPERSRPIFTIFCDETQNLAENDLGILITEGRKYSASIFTSSQYWQQLSPDLRNVLFAAGSHVIFRVSAHDARTLSSELSGSTRHKQNQLTDLERGQAIVRIGSAPAQLVNVPTLPSGRSVIPIRELRQLVRTRNARDRHEVEREIRNRRDAAGHANLGPTLNEQTTTQPEGQTGW